MEEISNADDCTRTHSQSLLPQNNIAPGPVPETPVLLSLVWLLSHPSPSLAPARILRQCLTVLVNVSCLGDRRGTPGVAQFRRTSEDVEFERRFTFPMAQASL